MAFDVADRLGLDAWVSNAGISFMHRFPRRPHRAVRPDDGRQPQGRVRLRSGRRPRDGAHRHGGRDRQHRIDGGQAGPGAVPVRLRGVEVRRRRPHPGDGVRTRRARHHRQLRLPRLRRNPHAVKGTGVGSRNCAARTTDGVRHDDDRRHPAASTRAARGRRTSRSRSCSPPTPASSPGRRSPSTAAPTWTRPRTRRAS